jgi:hypothetical protein
MNGPLVQEFRSDRIRLTLPGALGAVYSWTSPLLSTKFAAPGAIAGKDRRTTPYINGLLQAKFYDKAIYDSDLTITAMLIGEYAGIPGTAASKSFTFFAPISKDEALTLYQSNGALIFDELSSFTNSAQNIYMKVTIGRFRVNNPGLPTNIDVQFSGVLLASV